MATSNNSFILLSFTQKFNTFSSQKTTKEIEGWGWKCGYDVGVNVEFWWMARVSRLLTNVMEIQQWEYEQQTNRECFILILSRSPLWSDCWTTIGHFLPGRAVSSAVSSRCPVLATLVLGSNNPRDATEETLTIQRSDGTNMKLDRRMPLGESCLSQEASLVTFRSESIMIPE